MQEERLVNLAVLSVEQEISRNLNFDEVIDKFAADDKNPRIILSQLFYISCNVPNYANCLWLRVNVLCAFNDLYNIVIISY